MVNLNTINRVEATYRQLFNRHAINLLNSANSVQTSNDRHDKQDRRQLADRRRKNQQILLEQPQHRARRFSRPARSASDIKHSIDTIA